MNTQTENVSSEVKEGLSSNVSLDPQVEIERDDVFNLIKRDHKVLKNLLDTVSDPDLPVSHKRNIFKEFENKLMHHTRAEEASLYQAIKAEDSLRLQALEGEAEHENTRQQIKEIHTSYDDDEVWVAKINVFSNLVKNHLLNEENTLFGDVKKKFDENARMRIGDTYLEMYGENVGTKEEREYEDYFDEEYDEDEYDSITAHIITR